MGGAASGPHAHPVALEPPALSRYGSEGSLRATTSLGCVVGLFGIALIGAELPWGQFLGWVFSDLPNS